MLQVFIYINVYSFFVFSYKAAKCTEGESLLFLLEMG